MPPPMTSASTLLTRFASRSSLVETFAPPTMAITGFFGVPSAFSRASSSACMVRPAIGREHVAEAFGRGVRAVRGGEGVVDPDVAELCQRRRRTPDRSSPLPCGSACSRGRAMSPSFMAATAFSATSPMQSSAKATGRPITCASGCGNRLQRLLRIAALRPAEMREQDHLAALVGDLGDGRRHALDAGEVGDPAAFHRDVEIDAQKDALALHVDVVEGFEGLGHAGYSSRASSFETDLGPPQDEGLRR